MQTVLLMLEYAQWAATHWDAIAGAVGAVVAAVAHLMAVFGVGGRFGQLLDVVAGNYGRAKNAAAS